MYEDLKAYTSGYTSQVELEGTMTFTFSSSETYGTVTDPYPYVYPVTLTISLDGGDLISYWYADGTESPSHVQVTVTQNIQTAYSGAVDEVVQAALADEAVQKELAASIENIMDSVSGNATFQNMVNAMGQIGFTDAQAYLTDALSDWQAANLNPADLTGSPVYQIYWEGKDVGYDNTAILNVVEAIAEQATEYTWDNVVNELGEWAANAMFRYVSIENLQDTLETRGIDLGLDEYPALENYVLARMCELLSQRTDGATDEDSSSVAPAMEAEINRLLTDALESTNAYGTLSKFLKAKEISSLQDVTLGTAAQYLTNERFLSMVGDRGSSYVERLVGYIHLLPARASVTVAGATLNEAALSEFQDAENVPDLCEALANLIQNSGDLAELSISDFFGDGQVVTVQYGARTFSFHLVLKLEEVGEA